MKAINLEKTYKEDIQPKLSEELGGLNIYVVPKLKKIVLNVGVGKFVMSRKANASEAATEEDVVKDISSALAMIAGQRPRSIRAQRSIAGFKLREGMLIGLSVTLRGRRMYDFLARLIHIALPRTRDFRGILLKSVDEHGNLTIGIKDATIFVEMPQSNFNLGFEATLVTTTKDRGAAMKLFKQLGVPFEKSDTKK